MFSFFGKKEKLKVSDCVFISNKAKTAAAAEKLRNTPDTITITWFDESYDALKQNLFANNLNSQVYLAREASFHLTQNKPVIFFEHYPLSSKEFELAEKLHLKEMIFYTSLDEPFFEHFGGNRIISLMEKLGLSENEAIEHAMISNAIKNAQKKIAGKITMEHTARSQKEWFIKNLPSQH